MTGSYIAEKDKEQDYRHLTVRPFDHQLVGWEETTQPAYGWHGL